MYWKQPLIDDVENKHCLQSEQATDGYKHPVITMSLFALLRALSTCETFIKALA